MQKVLSCLLVLVSLGLFADVSMPAMFTDHAVLARTGKTPVFGKAAPGEGVTVSIAGLQQKTTADEKGKWRVNLNLQNVAEGPFELVVQGKNQVTVKDVLVGEVWLCSGQSNMGFTVNREERAEQIKAQCANNKIRLFKIPLKASFKKEEDVNAKWEVVAPENVGRFTAVGYLFGKQLQAELKCPIGLMDNAWGGSNVEAWVTRDFIQENPELLKWCLDKQEFHINYMKNQKEYEAQYQEWLKKNNLKVFEKPAFPDEGEWKGKFSVGGFVKTVPAEIWYRKTVVIPESFTKNKGQFNLGQHGAEAIFYLDGKEIARNNSQKAVKGGEVLSKVFNPNELTPGEHQFVVRYWTAYNGFATRSLERPAFPNAPAFFTQMERAVFPLKLTAEQAKDRPARLGRRDTSNHIPEILYNALIHPLKPYAISGTIWYQGCSNAGRYAMYPAAIQGLIKEWRHDFESEFPFYYCQLANYLAKSSDPNAAGWGNIRVGQEGALALPKTGQAILIDCGEAQDIHPIDKMTPAGRLAAVALAKTYGKKIPYSGPVFKSKSIEGNKIRISFDFVEGGLVAKELPKQYPLQRVKNRVAPLVRNSPNSQLEGFALAGADGKFYWADAKIEGDTVVVWSEKVPQPKNVRYAFQSNPTCNLYNKAGFPAGGFDK